MSSDVDHAPARLVRAGNILFRRRNIFVPVVLIGLLAGLSPACRGDGVLDDPLADLVGVTIALSGQALRVAVIGYAYIQRGGRKGRVYAARLVSEGFFAHSRNPLYLGNLLILSGLFLVHGNPWAITIGVLVFFFVYRAIVASEELYLRQEFGAEYERYCARVRRWIPDLRGLRRSLAACRFDWRRVIVKEYGSAYSWSATLVLLLGYQSLRCGSPGVSMRGVGCVAGALALLTCGWAVARYFKKGQLLPHTA